jgi:GNAT superfamily N-acetyltransferase
MKIQDGLFDVPSGKVATIVTSLEMLAKPPFAPNDKHPDWVVRHMQNPQTDWYREIYARIGAEWLWYSRMYMPDEELSAIISHPMVEVRVLELGGRAEGLLELDFRGENECELAYFGLSKKLIGTGAGKWLMQNGLELAWKKSIKRLWVHTCTIDHPRALQFYLRSGFAPFRRQLEIADDPRIKGLLPRDSAGHYPVI